MIYISASPLLDPFQKYLEISFVFGSSVCTANGNTTVGNENVVLGLFGGGIVGRKILIGRQVCE